jgi:hypothetical protein
MHKNAENKKIECPARKRSLQFWSVTCFAIVRLEMERGSDPNEISVFHHNGELFASTNLTEEQNMLINSGISSWIDFVDLENSDLDADNKGQS